jgi:hypothetical protein
MDPDISDFEPELPPGTLGWSAYCAAEGCAVGDTSSSRSDAEAHSAETSHETYATPVYLDDEKVEP